MFTDVTGQHPYCDKRSNKLRFSWPSSLDRPNIEIFVRIFQTEKERSFIWCVDTTVCVNLCKKLFRCPRFLYSTFTHTITSDNETKLIEANFDRGTLKTDIETSETVNREACVGTWLKNGYNTNYRGSNSRNC